MGCSVSVNREPTVANRPLPLPSRPAALTNQQLPVAKTVKFAMPLAAPLEARQANSLLVDYLQNRNKRDARQLVTAIEILRGPLSRTQRSCPLFPDLITRLMSCSAELYEATKQTIGFDDALRYGRQAWQSGKKHAPAAMIPCLYFLGLHLGWQHKETGNVAYLEEAIQAERELVHLGTVSSSRSSEHVHRLAFSLWKMYNITGEIAQLNESIQLGRLALELNPNEDRAPRLDNVSLRLERRYKVFRNRTDLDESIQLTRLAVEASPEGHPALGDYLESLAANLRLRFLLTVSIADTREAAEAQLRALELLGNCRGDQANMLFGYAIDLQQAYELEGVTSDLHASLNAYKQASQLFPDNHPNQSIILHEIGVLSAQRSETPNSRQRLDACKNPRNGHEAAEAGRQDETAGQKMRSAARDSGPSSRLCGYAERMYGKFGHTSNMQDLEQAVSLNRQAVNACSVDDPLRCKAINNLGSCLLHHHALTHDPVILDECITLFSDIVDTTDPSRSDRLIYLLNLGVSLLRRHKLQHSDSDLRTAVKALSAALEGMPDEHESRASVLYSYALALTLTYSTSQSMSDWRLMAEAKSKLDALATLRMAEELYKDTGNVLYLEDEIKQIESYRDDKMKNCAKKALFLTEYSWMLGTHFEATGRQESLLGAIEAARQAVACSDQNSSQLCDSMYTLGVQLSNEDEFFGTAGVLEEAIQVTRRALTIATEHYYHTSTLVNSLALRLRARYEQTGDKNTLEEAVQLSAQNLQATSDGSPLLPIACSNHSLLLGLCYSATGRIVDLDDAIALGQKSLRLTRDGDLNKPMFGSILAIRLMTKYERTLEMASLNEAIRVSREAVANTPDESPDRALRVRALADCLYFRYKRTGDTAELDEAISTLRSCINKAPLTHFHAATIMDVLANCLEAKYANSQDKADANEALMFGQRAVEMTSLENIQQSSIISNHMTRLRLRFEDSNESRYLKDAIRIGEQAVAKQGNDLHGHAGIWYSLGLCRAMQGDKTAVEALHRAWSFEEGTPQTRVFAAGRCMRLLSLLGRQDEAMKLGHEILAFLPTIHTRHLQQSDQQEVMAAFAGIASDLCAICIDQGKIGAALRSLEHGRAVIIGQLLSDRTELPKLANDRPDLARRYEDLLWEAGVPSGSVEMLARDIVVKGRPRKEVMEDLNACLWEIRDVKGYGTFLLPLEHEDMQRCAVGGVVAVVNITSIRSDAMLIMNDSVQTISLPQITKSEAEEWLTRDWSTKKRSEWYQLQQDYSAYLEWLWNVCVKHVVDAIEVVYARASARELPKVWWIGSGLASSMPLHAAGVHSGKSRDNALDRLVSSYTPSIKALAAARDQSRKVLDRKDTGSMLITTMPTTPKAPGARRPANLPNVIREANEISKTVGSSMHVNVANGPSVEMTMAALPSCSIAHFACHGMSDCTDPSNSCVILQRQADGGALEQDRLTVRHVSSLTMERAHVAYLSACSAAENKVFELRDEVLHLVSGFQASGFPHVIGCLWPAGDEECVKVATRFYSLLLHGENGGSREPCRALHDAVVALRDEDPDMPLLWAQFVHYGW